MQTQWCRHSCRTLEGSVSQSPTEFYPSWLISFVSFAFSVCVRFLREIGVLAENFECWKRNSSVVGEIRVLENFGCWRQHWNFYHRIFAIHDCLGEEIISKKNLVHTISQVVDEESAIYNMLQCFVRKGRHLSISTIGLAAARAPRQSAQKTETPLSIRILFGWWRDGCWMRRTKM